MVSEKGSVLGGNGVRAHDTNGDSADEAAAGHIDADINISAAGLNGDLRLWYKRMGFDRNVEAYSPRTKVISRRNSVSTVSLFQKLMKRATTCKFPTS